MLNKPTILSFSLHSIPFSQSFLLALLLLCSFPSAAANFVGLVAIDAQTNEPISGVTFRTEGDITVKTDVHGIAAFYEPGWMNRNVFFAVEKEGYAHAELSLVPVQGKIVRTDESTFVTFLLTRTEGSLSEPVTHQHQTDLLTRGSTPDPEEYAALRFTDAQTGRPLPMVEVQLGEQVWVSDNAGLVAIYRPDLFGAPASATIFSHGYGPAIHTPVELELTLHPNQVEDIALERQQVAERLYRITGSSRYLHARRLNEAPQHAGSPLNSDVVGQDSVFSVEHRGQLYWFWGDTQRPGHPLGNFHVSGATSPLPTESAISPDVDLQLTYFENENGFSRPMAPASATPGDGVTWIGGVVSVPDAWGNDRLFAHFGRYRDLQRNSAGMLEFNDATQEFELAYAFTPDSIEGKGGTMVVDVKGTSYVYYDNRIRVVGRPFGLRNNDWFERFTPFLDDEGTIVERDAMDRPVYRFRRTAAVTHAQIEDGILRGEETFLTPARDPQSGVTLLPHDNTTIAYNPYRGRYVRLILEVYGEPSFAGELWYSEADSPMGPWTYARKIVSHDNYTFYNPRQHPHFAEDGGRHIYFEGTYTKWLTDAIPTPRYDYNQIMYRLDVANPQIHVPVPIYQVSSNAQQHFATINALSASEAAGLIGAAAFYAYDQESEGLVAVYHSHPCAKDPLTTDPLQGGEIAFYARTEPIAGNDAMVPLYRYVNEETQTAHYSLGETGDDGFTRDDEPLVFVWENPSQLAYAIDDYLPEVVADAGEHQCHQADASGTADVQFDASLSHFSNEVEANYRWTIGGEVYQGEELVITLGQGQHEVELEILIQGDVAAKNRSSIEVIPLPTRGPSSQTTEPGESPEAHEHEADTHEHQVDVHVDGRENQANPDSSTAVAGCSNVAGPSSLWVFTLLFGISRRRRVKAMAP